MNHSALKKFAQSARRKLIGRVDTQLNYVLDHDDPYLRAHGAEKRKIKELIEKKGRDRVIEETAYVWFNRLTAFRFMDLRGYNRIGIVSPAAGESQPHILAEIKRGAVPEEIAFARKDILDNINGRIESSEPDREAYKIALTAWCNYLGRSMPFLFKPVDDWAALLLPRDLLSEESIITDIQRNLTAESCADVEIIGWLYQYYISEKKNEVFDGLKMNKKITPENIPAATQLFTPHWIVRYLAENSLGRLWLKNRPDSRLIDSMEYFIPEEEDSGELLVNSEEREEPLTTNHLPLSSPEDIRLCDPACGSGHMLTYAFDLLYQIYEEEGYSPSDIPGLIIRNNLYGIEIDERAGELAAFALAMKAREKDRYFMENPVQPHIRVLENVDFSFSRKDSYRHDMYERDLFDAPDPEEIIRSRDDIIRRLAGEDISRRNLLHDLELFSEADNFGSLLRPALSWEDIVKALERLDGYEKNLSAPTFTEREIIDACRTALIQSGYLTQRYHVVIANPPYMGGKGMNGRLSAWAKENYPDSKSDLFAMFIERNLELSIRGGSVAMITMQSWMFLSSFEKLRNTILSDHTILSMAHLGARAFDSIGGEVVSTTSFVLEHGHRKNYKGGFVRLVDGGNEAEKDAMLRETIEKLKKQSLNLRGVVKKYL